MSDPMDKIFREKLGRHKVAVKPDLWAAIAADQATKRRQTQWRKAALYGGSLLLLLCLGYFGFAYNNPTADQPALSNNTKLTTKTSTSATAATTTTQPQLIDSQTETTQESETSFAVLTEAPSTSIAQSSTPQKSTITLAAPLTRSVPSTEPVPSPASKAEMVEPAKIRTLPDAAARIPNLPLPLLSPRLHALPRLAPQVLARQTSGFTPGPKKRFTVDVLLGPAYANQQFDLADETHRNLLDIREISEFPGVSILAGLRISYLLKGRWSLRSGLLFTQIRNRFEFEQIPTGPDQELSLIKSTNRINLLEIPLLASYEIPGRRLRLSINAGPVLNLSTSASGRYLLPDLMEPADLKDDNIYRSNIGLSYQASLTAAYDLGKGNSLLIEPTFRTYRSSFTRSDYALTERYWITGLQVGLRHRLR